MKFIKKNLEGSRIDITSFYEEALTSLAGKDQEKAIKYIILALDIDRAHEPTLHLCRTMLYSLGLFLTENNLESYKNKYKSLKLACRSLKQKITELDEKILKTREELEREKELIKKGATKQSKELKEMLALEKTLKIYESSKNPAVSELKVVSGLYQAEEYVNILNTVLQICLLPSLY